MQVEYQDNISTIVLNKVVAQSFKQLPVTYKFSPASEMADPTKEMRDWVRALRCQAANGGTKQTLYIYKYQTYIFRYPYLSTSTSLDTDWVIIIIHEMFILYSAGEMFWD